MKKAKPVLALIGVILLVSLYIATLVFSLIQGELALSLFKASVGCTILVPCLLYGMMLIYRVLDKRNQGKS